MWAGRGLSVLNVPPELPTTWEGWVSDWNILAPLAVKSVLGLSILPGKDTVYFAPFFQPIEAALLLVGAGVLIWRWRQPAAFLLLLWGLSVTLTSVLLDASTIPNFAHWAPAFPAFFLALALPVALWLGAMRRVGRRAGLVGAAVVAGGLIWAGGANAYAYLATYPTQVPVESSMDTVQGRFIAAAGAHARIRVVGTTWQPVRPDVAAMMNPQSPSTNFFNPSRELPVVGDPTRDQVFIFYNDELHYLPIVQYYYPGGQTADLRTPGGIFVATTYSVPAAQVWARYGVIATITDQPDHIVWRGQVPTVGALPDGVTFPYPVTATWSGAFYKPTTDAIQLSVQGVFDARAWVMGEPVRFNEPITVDTGWAPFSIQARLNEPTHLQLLLQVGARPGVAIETAHLWPQLPNQGLLASINGTMITHRIDPFLGADILGTNASQTVSGIPAPVSDADPEVQPLAPLTGGGGLIRWEGEVLTDEGNYMMELHTDGHGLFIIDGKQLITICNNNPGEQVVGRELIRLTSGVHRVRVDLHATGAVNGVQWIWVRPDKVREVVPPWRLRFQPQESLDVAPAWPPPPAPVPCGP
jgi:hypothetical protein